MLERESSSSIGRTRIGRRRRRRRRGFRSRDTIVGRLHERRPLVKSRAFGLPPWGKKGGILKLGFFCWSTKKQHTIGLLRIKKDLSNFDALDLLAQQRRLRKLVTSEQGSGGARLIPRRATESALAIGKREEKQKWKRWRTTRGDDGTRTTKIRRRASDAETSHRCVIGEQPD